MNRTRLAALILTASFGLLSGCTAYYSVGMPNGGDTTCGNGGGGGGGLLGLFGHRRTTNGVGTGSYAPGCCDGFCGADGCCGGGIPDFGVAPPAAIPVPTVPAPGPTVAPPPLPMPMSPEPPIGNGMKYSPAPKALPFPYTPTGY